MAVYPVTGGSLQALAGGTGNFSTDRVDRGALGRPGLIQIDLAAGTTITANIQGSVDGVNWFNVPYATTAAPQRTGPERKPRPGSRGYNAHRRTGTKVFER